MKEPAKRNRNNRERRRSKLRDLVVRSHLLGAVCEVAAGAEGTLALLLPLHAQARLVVARPAPAHAHAARVSILCGSKRRNECCCAAHARCLERKEENKKENERARLTIAKETPGYTPDRILGLCAARPAAVLRARSLPNRHAANRRRHLVHVRHIRVIRPASRRHRHRCPLRVHLCQLAGTCGSGAVVKKERQRQGEPVPAALAWTLVPAHEEEGRRLVAREWAQGSLHLPPRDLPPSSYNLE
eukprot:2495218-Rhodomonas_salina.1